MYPGQLFKVPVVLYGQRNGTVPGIVNSTLTTQMSSVHTNVQDFSVEDASLTLVWQLEHPSV